MTREFGARFSTVGSSEDWTRVKTSVAIPRSLNAAQTSRTYTLSPPFAFWPSGAVGEVCMDMTATRIRASRSELNRARSATVGRSRVEPASRDAAEPGPRDRRTGTHCSSKTYDEAGYSRRQDGSGAG